MDTNSLKKTLRKEIKVKRQALAEAEVRDMSKNLFELWRNEFSLNDVRNLHLFLSIVSRKEVDTSGFLEFIWREYPHIRTAVPVVEKSGDALLHLQIEASTVLISSSWGIPEPVQPGTTVSPSDLDVILIPMLAFDLSGNRLGYGKGHYDRFLSQTRPECLKIGLCFELGKSINGLPHGPHDVPLDFVVTEKAIYRFSHNLKA